MTMIIARRSFLTGLAGIIAAPAIVSFQNLMPIRGIIMPPKPKLIVPVLEDTSHYAECVALGVGGTPGPYGRHTWKQISARDIMRSPGKIVETITRPWSPGMTYQLGDIIKINRTNGVTARLRREDEA